MRYGPPPDLRRAARRVAIMLAMGLAAGSPPRAEERVLVQGLADALSSRTDDRSELLSLNDGRTASLGRLRLWMAVDLHRGWQAFALGDITGGSAYEDGETETDLEQAYVRYTARSARLVVQAGKLGLPYGNFSRRYFSSVNPLIGEPLGTTLSYPLGVQVNGAARRFDYMLAVLDGPLTRQEYLADPTSSLRPAVAFGITPVTGLRLGIYATRGSYLTRAQAALLPPGTEWRDEKEEILGLDLQLSRGHFELNGELTRSRLQVPGAPDARGWVAYLEPKYTWSPRWFTAVRLERGSFIEVEPQPGVPWLSEAPAIYDLEAGVGFRIAPGCLAKASYRAGLAGSDAELQGTGAHAVSVQVSYSFDVRSWFRPAR